MADERNPRLDILRKKVDSEAAVSLRTHGWVVESIDRLPPNDCLLVRVSRSDRQHTFALNYDADSAKKVGPTLPPAVEVLFCQSRGDLSKYAANVSVPYASLDDLHDYIIEWNETFATDGGEPSAGFNPGPVKQPRGRDLTDENPLDQIWAHLHQYKSITLAKKLIEERAAAACLEPTDIRSKAEGVAFCIRNASDYFGHATATRPNLTQRVLNCYYGAMALAEAEMLAAPAGPNSLDEVERMTRFGHGLYTLDASDNSFPGMVIGPLDRGFYRQWVEFQGCDISGFPSKKPKKPADLEKQADGSFTTMEELLARIPEISALFCEVFDSPPLASEFAFDHQANGGTHRKSKHEKTYGVVVDRSCRLTPEIVKRFKGPISQVAQVASRGPGVHIRFLVDHTGQNSWWQGLDYHASPWAHAALLVPLFNQVTSFRAIATALLYALSIIVRYKPSVWRRIDQGDWDAYRALIESFVNVAERVLPEKFLQSIVDEPIYARQPGTLG